MRDQSLKPVVLREDEKYTFSVLAEYLPGLQNPGSMLQKILKNSCEETESGYTFHYTGLLEYQSPKGDFLLFFIPKYLRHVRTGPSDVLLQKESAEFQSFRRLFKTLNQYQNRAEKQDAVKQQAAGGIMNPLEKDPNENRLALSIHLVQDFLQNGVYENTIAKKQLCGSGEIDWQQTIDTTFPVIQENKPFYMNYWTSGRTSHTDTVIARIHECIISECSRKLSQTGLADLLEIETPLPYEGDLSDFGEKETILYLIYRELSVQFMTRKQNLLKLMAAYIKGMPEYQSENSISLYGSDSFHAVWEAVCASVYGDQRNELLPADCNATGKMTWKDLIPDPVWQIGERKKHAGTLKTDFVALQDETFYILDAKYYYPDWENNGNDTVAGAPGIGDIDKQHLYQLAYAPLIQKHGWKTINAFLMPRDGESSPKIQVYNPIFGYFREFHIVPIQVVFLNPDDLFECYLKHTNSKENLEHLARMLEVDQNMNPADIQFPSAASFPE